MKGKYTVKLLTDIGHPLFRTAKVQNNIKPLLNESKIFIVIKDGEIQ